MTRPSTTSTGSSRRAPAKPQGAGTVSTAEVAQVPQGPAASAASGGHGTRGGAAPDREALLHPERATARAPDRYVVQFETTKGPFRVVVHRDWAPRGADRFYNLVKMGFYDGVAFFRVIRGFVVQFGIHGDPRVSAAWRNARIPDDPVRESNLRGRITFATAGPNTRTTQVFINLVDNRRLDAMGFAPFGEVPPKDMHVVEQLYSGYGEGAPRGRGPSQARIQSEGNAYLKREFPELDYVVTARVVEAGAAANR